MNEFTYTLAILVRKDILTIDEAKKLMKARNEGVMSATLGEMITKVDSALKRRTINVETLDARDIIGR